MLNRDFIQLITESGNCRFSVTVKSKEVKTDVFTAEAQTDLCNFFDAQPKRFLEVANALFNVYTVGSQAFIFEPERRSQSVLAELEGKLFVKAITVPNDSGFTITFSCGSKDYVDEFLTTSVKSKQNTDGSYQLIIESEIASISINLAPSQFAAFVSGNLSVGQLHSL